MQPDKAAEILGKALGKKGNFADLYQEDTETTYIVYENDRLEKVVTGGDKGAGLRTIYGDFHTAYAYTNELSASGIVTLAEELASITESPGPKISIDEVKKVPFPEIKRPPFEETLTTKIDLVKKANRAARGVSPEVVQVKVIYQDVHKKITIANSQGIFIKGERIYTLLAVQVVARRGEIIQTGYEPLGGAIGLEIFEKTPPEEIAIKAAKRAILMLSAPKAPGGTMPVVLSAEAGGTMIHEAVGHGLEADLAEEGFSVYAGKIGQQVASPLITVIDDPTLLYQRGYYQFDDEGVFAQKTVLIEDGVLKDFLYDRLSAMKAGKESNGHGRRESYRHRPIPRMSNTYIAPGPHTPEEIIRSVDKGLFVKKMGGGQVDTISGNFVFEVTEGYLIEKGLLGEPVRGATISGNGPQVLQIIDMVGHDLGFTIGTCGKDGQGVPVSDGQPTLRIPEIVVGGAVEK
ncbi:TldD/PmbA family protein [Thermodesulfatator autotrophicus]|uniref:Peptidase C69 n=1 Tax=Thermodesulfatator autotrophicus TaxID=1795632 RepID=A0A177E583_9BACT|nr:TldD/PmbA family protein [Thermodesulfatator autotrophicus]OAG26866.1 peptidase C69 [Thermodesulfatator autotrophicus]